MGKVMGGSSSQEMLLEIELPVEMPTSSYVGVFVKGGSIKLSEVVIEDSH